MSPPSASQPTSDRDRPLGAAGGQLAAWAAIAAINAVVIAATLPAPSATTRVAHHFHDAAQILALGLLSAAVLDLRRRLLPSPAPPGKRRLALDVAALTAASIAVGFPVLWDDFTNFAGRLAGPEGGSSARPILVALIVGTSLGVPAAALIGRLLDRPRLRWIAVLAALGAATANHFILRSDYPGVHFEIAWAAAACGGAAMVSRRVPRLFRPSRALRVAGHCSYAAIAMAAAVAVVRWPGEALMVELYKTPGAVVAPFRARLQHEATDVDGVAIPRELEPWFRDRALAPGVPPSAPPPSPPSRIVVLLFIDSLRADVIGSPENLQKLPELAALAKGGVEFTDARSPGSQTVYSFTAVFAGKYFSQMYWVDKPPDGFWAHRDDSIRFPELLARAGVPTVTFASARWLINEFGAVKGFTEETVVNPETTRKRPPMGSELVDGAIARLRTAGSGPLFLFIDFMDAHAPYDRAGTHGSPFERYVREAALVDREIGRLQRAARELGLADRTTYIVTSDHGDAFGEHGTIYHSVSLYEELLRVPLLMRTPGGVARRVDTPVSLIDLGPTILDLMGLATPGSYMGQSLAPFLRGETPALTRPIVAEGRLKQAMVFPDRTKVIRDQRKGTVEIYDLKTDPEELTNLYGKQGGAKNPKLGLLRRFFQVHTLKRPGYKPPYRP